MQATSPAKLICLCIDLYRLTMRSPWHISKVEDAQMSQTLKHYEEGWV